MSPELVSDLIFGSLTLAIAMFAIYQNHLVIQMRGKSYQYQYHTISILLTSSKLSALMSSTSELPLEQSGDMALC